MRVGSCLSAQRSDVGCCKSSVGNTPCSQACQPRVWACTGLLEAPCTPAAEHGTYPLYWCIPRLPAHYIGPDAIDDKRQMYTIPGPHRAMFTHTVPRMPC